MAKVFLGLGSNMGDKKDYLDRAIVMIKNISDTKVQAVSSFYETDPVGYEKQDSFLNCVVEIETKATPQKILEEAQKIEQILKRKRMIRWGPRTIDVDILCVEGYTSKDVLLTLPHPRLTERAFVLVPFCELAPEWIVDGHSIGYWLSKVDQSSVRKMEYGT